MHPKLLWAQSSDRERIFSLKFITFFIMTRMKIKLNIRASLLDRQFDFFIFQISYIYRIIICIIKCVGQKAVNGSKLNGIVQILLKLLCLHDPLYTFKQVFYSCLNTNNIKISCTLHVLFAEKKSFLLYDELKFTVYQNILQ